MDAKGFTLGLVGLLVSLMVAGQLLPEIITTIQDVNTDLWTFTGSAGAVTMWGLLGLLVIIGIFVGVMTWAIKGGIGVAAMSPMPTQWLARLLRKLGRN